MIFSRRIKTCLSVFLIILLEFLFPFLKGFAESDSDLKFEIRISKANGVLYLLQTLTGHAHQSPELAEYFRARKPNTLQDQKQLKDFRSVLESQSISLPRHNTEMALETLAASTPDLQSFLDSSRALLSVDNSARLSSSIKHFLPAYEEYIWQPSEETLIGFKQRLENEAQAVAFEEKLKRVRLIYASRWPSSCKFSAVLVPIIAEKMGATSAHSVGSVSILEVVKGQSPEHAAGIGAIFHEFCHSLWQDREERSDHSLELAFKEAGGFDAYNLVDEALATALGNYVISALKGALPEEPWYAGNGYESDYAKAIYPVVLKYFDSARPLDNEFAKSISSIFQKKFPKAHNDPVVAFWNTIAIYDRGKLGNKVSSILPSTSHYYTEVNDKTGFEREVAAHPSFTLLFMITPGTLRQLSDYSFTSLEIKQISAFHKQNPSQAWCKTKAGRWAIVCVGKNEEQQKSLLKKLIDSGKIEQ